MILGGIISMIQPNDTQSHRPWAAAMMATERAPRLGPVGPSDAVPEVLEEMD